MAKKKAAPAAPPPAAPPPAAPPPAAAPADEKPAMVKQPAVVEKPVVVEVKAAAVLDTSTLEATAKAAAASSTEQNLQDFTTVVAARRARMAKLRVVEGAAQANKGRSESLSRLATEWDTLRKIMLSRGRELALEAKAFVDKTPRKELMVKTAVAMGVLLVLITIVMGVMHPSSGSRGDRFAPGAQGGTFELDNVIDSVITSGPDMMAADGGKLLRGRKSLLSSPPSSSSRKQTPLSTNRRKARPTAHWTSDSLPAVKARMQLPALVLATSKDFVGGDGLILGVGAGAFAVQVLKDWTSVNKLVLVDPFENNPALKYGLMADGSAHAQEERMMTVADLVKDFHSDTGQHVTLLRKGIAAMDAYQRRSFSFIYLDYTYSIQLLEAALSKSWSKLKAGGVLAGSDFLNVDEMEALNEAQGRTAVLEKKSKCDRHATECKGYKGVRAVVEEFCKSKKVKLHSTADERPTWYTIKDEA